MIRRWKFYLHLGWLDLVRLWPTTRHHAIIVAGICLPILMLLGIKRGHVAELRRDLVTSPIGRQITFWSARKGELMDRDAVARLSDELPLVEVIIPETQRVVGVSRIGASGSDDSGETESTSTKSTIGTIPATIYATRPGDPQLLQLGIQSPVAGERSIILGEGLAKRLHVGIGDQIALHLKRGRDNQEENVELTCTVVAVMSTEQKDALIGYMDLDLLDAFEQYVRGQRVTAFNWPSARNPARDAYSSYLIFCEKTNDLTVEDRKLFVDRGFLLTDCTENPPAPFEHLLKQELRESLRIYEASTAQLSLHPEPRLLFAPSEMSEQTQADDVVVPWNLPAAATMDGQQWTLAGVSMPRRTWLREYFIRADLPFDYDAEPFQARAVGSQASSSLVMMLDVDQSLEIRFASETANVAGRDKPSTSMATNGSPQPNNELANNESEMNHQGAEKLVAVVPANLTAWLGGYRAGLVGFDSSIQLFIPLPQLPVYDRARLYARTIDDVPAIVAELSAKKFAVMSETGRIAEIHRQDRSLQLLVWVVGLGVFLFGIVTVVSVLMDSTDRKRGTIGILRVMGVSPGGIFISILLRSGMIGLLAAMISLICGWGLALALDWKPIANPELIAWKPIVHIELDPWDLAVVAAGALVCCGLGSLPPAWKASRLDPFDAIIEGRFR